MRNGILLGEKAPPPCSRRPEGPGRAGPGVAGHASGSWHLVTRRVGRLVSSLPPAGEDLRLALRSSSTCGLMPWACGPLALRASWPPVCCGRLGVSGFQTQGSHADQTLVLGLRLWRAGDPARALSWKKMFLRWGRADPLEAYPTPTPQAQGLGQWDGSVQEGIAGVSLPSWDLCFHSVPPFLASPCTGRVGVGCRVRLSVLSRFRELVSSGLHAHLFFRSHQWLWGRAGRAGAGRCPGEDRRATPPLRLRVQHLLQQQPALRRQVGPGCACSPPPALWSSRWGRHRVRAEHSLRTNRPRPYGLPSLVCRGDGWEPLASCG